MLRPLAILTLLLAPGLAHARSVTSATGVGAAYDVLKVPFGIEVPDCGHMVPHITQEMDAELGKFVFIFHAHVNLDDDRCKSTDRQRTEIRVHLDELTGVNGQTTYYRWKFKLPTGFQSSGNFTHIMQIKSEQGAPIMTLTPRSGNLSIDGRVGVHGTTPLAKFLGTWVVADMKILYGNAGHVTLTIKRISDGEMLFSYDGGADTWDDGSGGHDFKCGIYRSLNSKGALRDEQVRFADVCISHQDDCQAEGPATTPPPSADGSAAVEPDAGAPDPVPPDAAVTDPGPGSPPPDAASPARPADARPAMTPPAGGEDEPEPTGPTTPSPKSSGCDLGRGGVGPFSLVLLAAALLLWPLRRRR
jgi:hypothetical protein